MRRSWTAIHFAAACLFAAPAGAASQLNAVEYLDHCLKDTQPLRQTIAVVDEAMVLRSDGGGTQPDNTPWIRPLLDIADVSNEAIGNMLPGEKLTIFLARTDGSELALAFVGCSPNIDDAERARREEDMSAVSAFFFGGLDSEIAKERKAFESRLLDAFATIANNAGSAEGEQRAPSVILNALSQAGRLSDLTAGIPRVLLLSPFTGIDEAMLTSAKAARENGFAQGANLGIDLQRAEVYVCGVSPGIADKLKPFLEALLLRSRGLLVAIRSNGLPPLDAAPHGVQVFGGVVQMGDIPAPVQIRIAHDRASELVNSWIETTVGRLIATPFSGRIVCPAPDNCTVTGDGTLMGQAWNPDPAEEPEFRPDFAWAGLRYLEIKISGETGSARIWDPKVGKINAPNGETMQDFRFQLQRTPDIRF